MKIEERAIPFEVRIESAEGKPSKVTGTGAVYDRRSQDLGGFVEIIRRGAFKDSLEDGREIKSFYNHDPNQVLGTTTSEPPLKIRDTKEGLNFTVEIPDTSYGRDLQENLRRKNVKGSSFAFRVLDAGENWYRDDKGMTVREITAAELFELGPVTNPAYLPTTAAVRSLEEQKDSHIPALRAHEQELEIAQRARARRKRELEMLQIQTGGK